MHEHGGRGGPARLPRRRRPCLAVLVAVLALMLAAGACGGGNKGSGAASTTSPGGNGDPQQADLAFARCLCQHSIDLPDPTPDGSLPDRGRGLNPDDPRFKAAERACPGFRPRY